MPSRLRRYDEPGHTHFWTISCFRRLTFFCDDGIKQIVVDALCLLQQRFSVCLVGYVVMPDHVHVIVYPHASGTDLPIPISKLLHAFKQHVGYHGKHRLRELWRRDGKLWSEPLNRWAAGAFARHAIWTARGHDFNIEREDTLRAKLDYCHKNAVTRGLVDHPDEWRWSSYRFYEMDDRSLVAMDWDGAWPIVW